MKLSLMLCDHAEVADGKLFINGGGWDTTGAITAPFGAAVLLWVPWDRTNTRLRFELALYGEDGQRVLQPRPDGPAAVGVAGEFQVGRPPGAAPGSDLPIPLAMNFPPMQLQAGARYYFEATVDGETADDWRYAFSTRPEPAAPGAGSPTDVRLPDL